LPRLADRAALVDTGRARGELGWLPSDAIPGQPPAEENSVIEVSLDVSAGPDDVFDDGWPRVGARIHHSAGAWPVQIKDSTEVVAVQPGRFLELDAKLSLFGAARIRLTLTPAENGHGTHIVMAEEAVRGPGSLIPIPVQALLLRPRNIESLARLGDLALGHERSSSGHEEARAAR
jgi:hypothetical protein